MSKPGNRKVPIRDLITELQDHCTDYSGWWVNTEIEVDSEGYSIVMDVRTSTHHIARLETDDAGATIWGVIIDPVAPYASATTFKGAWERLA